MRKHLIFFVLLLISNTTFAQSEITTLILVRHAEKGNDGTNDPDLSDAGKARAESLASFLKKAKVDAVYSTDFKRTKNTVTPLAKEKGLTIETYNPSKLDEIDAMMHKYRGGTVVVAGHSNTTPAVVNYLTGKKDEYSAFDDSDYSNLIIVSVIEKGKSVKVVWLRY